MLMSGVFIWFLVGLYLLIKRTLLGYILTVAFLGVEFLFYLMTQITQFMSGHGILLYVINPSDPILFIVFGVGYVNFIASAFMLYFIIRYRTVFL